MGLLSTEVEIGLNGRNAIYYEKLGYQIPRSLDQRGRLTIKNGSKIVVKTKDLSNGSSATVDIECDYCKKKYSISYSNYIKINHDGKVYCKKCAILLFNTGENNSRYKKDKTTEERERKRLYPEYTKFIKKVLSRDNYICQCCGKNDTPIEVHHLDGYEWCKDRRVDEANGITLCKKCHSNFHAIYGSGNNTKEQFEEWMGHLVDLDKFNGEINSARKIYCYEEDKIYNSATEFIRIHKLRSTSTVYSVCNQLRFCKTIKGMHLFWYDKYINMTKEDVMTIVNAPSRRNSKKVICLTTNKIYNSIAEGARSELASETSISRCCCKETNFVITKDGRSTKWMYYNNYLKSILIESEVY